MSIMPYMGKCFTCGHDHGNGFIAPDMQPLLAENKRLKDEIELMRQQVSDTPKLRAVTLREFGWRYEIQLDWSNDRHHLVKLDNLTAADVCLAFQKLASLVHNDPHLLTPVNDIPGNKESSNDKHN